MPALASGGGAGNDTSPAETRRGRAWIDQAAGVRIGYAPRKVVTWPRSA